MSWQCPVIEVGAITKHPWADNLALTQIEGCTVVVPITMTEGMRCIFIPVDSVLDMSRPWFKHLQSRHKDSKTPRTTHHLKAVKIRGVFSMGMAIEVPAELSGLGTGDDASDDIGAEKYVEPPDYKMGGKQSAPPAGAPGAYGMESYRKYKELLIPGELVVVTEKLHGCNIRFMRGPDSRLFVGSHNCWWAEDDSNLWWNVARKYRIADLIPPGVVVYGEVYGDVQDLRYGAKPGSGDINLALFDIQDVSDYSFWSWAALEPWAVTNGLPVVPVIYKGAYDHEVISQAAQGESTLAAHIREGVVIKAEPSRRCLEIGRVIMKLHSEAYLLRKHGTEHH
jgi:RNA ligase (TIGR02306 family)